MIPGVHDLPLAIAAGLLLNITPGADMALIGARSAGQGFRSGAAAAFGVGAGCFVHVAAAALGLSALIAGSATAFTVLRWMDIVEDLEKTLNRFERTSDIISTVALKHS